jgi:hypothetical protein
MSPIVGGETAKPRLPAMIASLISCSGQLWALSRLNGRSRS